MISSYPSIGLPPPPHPSSHPSCLAIPLPATTASARLEGRPHDAQVLLSRPDNRSSTFSTLTFYPAWTTTARPSAPSLEVAHDAAHHTSLAAAACKQQQHPRPPRLQACKNLVRTGGRPDLLLPRRPLLCQDNTAPSSKIDMERL